MPDPEPLTFSAADLDLADNVWHVFHIEEHPTQWVNETAAGVYRCGQKWANGDRCETWHTLSGLPEGGRCRRSNVQPIGESEAGSNEPAG